MKKIKQYQFFLLALSLVTCISINAWSASYYIDKTNGNDRNYGLSASNAWKTISYLENYAKIKSGDTVYFKCGERWDRTFRPVSGAKNKYVTYKSYGKGSKPVIRNCFIENKTYINIQDINFKGTDPNTPVYIRKSKYISLKNCNIIAEKECVAYSSLMITMHSHHIKIINCNIEHRNLISQHDAVNLTRNVNSNLIKGCQINTATHYSLTISGNDDVYPSFYSKNNIIQNNIIENHEGALVVLFSEANFNLIENNVIRGGRTSKFSNKPSPSLSLRSSYNIIRGNVICNNLSSNSSSGISIWVHQYRNYPPHKAIGNKIYKNIIFNNRQTGVIFGNYNPDISKIDNNYFKNNVFYNNNFSRGQQIIIRDDGNIANNHFEGNIIYSDITKKIISFKNLNLNIEDIESKYPKLWSGNTNYLPKKYKLSLVPDSSMIESKIYLSHIISPSDFGNTFKVKDAGYFVDGFGIVNADLVEIDNNIFKIKHVNYNTNMITLNNPFLWEHGARIYSYVETLSESSKPELVTEFP